MRFFVGVPVGCLIVLSPFIIGAALVAFVVGGAAAVVGLVGLFSWRLIRRQPLLQHRGWFRGPLGRAL